MAGRSKAEQPVVDIRRMSHGDNITRLMHTLRMQQAQVSAAAGERVDLEAFEASIAANEDVLAKVVVSVPDDWLLDGVKFGEPGWIRHISQPHFDELNALSQLPAPGEKKV